MKVFNVSLHRSGTRSIHNFAKEVGGLRSLHWLGKEWESGYEKLSRRQVAEKFIKSTGDFDMRSDIPVPSIYDFLDDEYRNARFLLVLRDIRDWVRSVRGHIGNRAFNPLESLQYNCLCAKDVASLCQLSDKELLDIYELHTHTVKEYFSYEPSKLTIVKLGTESFYGDIKKFLKIESNKNIRHVGKSAPYQE